MITLTPATQPLEPADITVKLAQLAPGWAVQEQDGVPRLCKTYRLADFRQAMALAVLLGELAESVDHHPVLTVSWGKLGVQWWTHVLHGLHENDFTLAAASDSVAEEFMQNSGADRTTQS